MGDRRSEEDLALWQIRGRERRETAASPALGRVASLQPSPSGHLAAGRWVAGDGLDERMADLLRPAEVAAAFTDANAAPPGPAGEAVRRRFRLLAGPFLERAVVEEQAELDRRRAGLERPERGFEFEIVRAASTDERRRIHRQWSEYEARLAEPRARRTSRAAAAARAAGADSLCGFLAAAQPAAIESVRDAYGHTAIAPLDDAIERAARHRRLRSPLPLGQPEHPADSPMMACLAAYADRFPAAGIPPVLRTLGSGLGLDPDLDGPGVVHEPEACLRPRFWVTSRRPLALIGSLDGPAALHGALDAFGRAARHVFVAGLRGAAGAMASDPAFPVAAGTLFGRLSLAPAFRSRFGPRPDTGLDADLRMELALAPRLAWTYLHLVSRGRGSEAEPPGDAAARALRNALGRPAAPNQRLALYSCDPRGAGDLRGTVLALLLEERLLSRWGREWFDEDRAGRFLRECWESEDGQTAESVANVLDLGTIEPTPILDRCRP